MNMGIDVSLVAVREKERGNYTLLKKDSFNNICKKDSNKI